MARSSGERTRDVKRRYAIRGGSIPPRAEQQEKSIFCKHVSHRLKRYRPPERRTQGRQIHTHWRLGKTSKRPTTIGSKGLGNAHFFWQPERRQIKRRFTNGLPPGKNGGTHGRHSRYRAGAECKSLFFNASDSLLFSFVDAKHLARAPGSIPGSVSIFAKITPKKGR